MHTLPDRFPGVDEAQALFVALRHRPPAEADAIRAALAAASGTACFADLATAATRIAEVLAAYAATAPEPPYHNRHHFIEATLAMGWLAGAARDQGWIDARSAALGVVAMVGHDLLHDGSPPNADIPVGSLEARSAQLTCDCAAASGVPAAELAVIAAVIAGTEPSLTATNAARAAGDLPPGPLGPDCDRLCALADEADRLGSLLPELGWQLSEALAVEWAGAPDVADPASFVSHLAFLRSVPLPTPAARSLGLAAVAEAQIRAYALAVPGLGADGADAAAAALDAMPRLAARAAYRAALQAARGGRGTPPDANGARRRPRPDPTTSPSRNNDIAKPVSCNTPKRIKLALQGGGSHGAFTWGVLDRLMEDPRLEVEAIVGTSAGAMNATVTAYGLATGGAAAARELLTTFWSRCSEAGQAGLYQPSPLDRMLGQGNMDYSPMWQFGDMLSKMFSPYELNPGNLNPLRDLLASVVDFERLRAATAGPRLFVCAVNVRTSRLRVFERAEITPDAVMASACLPQIFQAVEIDGEAYWDGGYCGNPPIFPVIYMGGCQDILIIQIDPINIPEIPRTASAIHDRTISLSFNISLMREMRAIKFVSDLIDRGELDKAKHLRVFIHTIDAETELAPFAVSSKINSEMGWLRHLFDIGRAKADAFLAAHFDDIGKRSSTDIAAKFL